MFTYRNQGRLDSNGGPFLSWALVESRGWELGSQIRESEPGRARGSKGREQELGSCWGKWGRTRCHLEDHPDRTHVPLLTQAGLPIFLSSLCSSVGHD